MILFPEVLEDIILLFVVVSMNLLRVCLSLWIGTYRFRAHLHWGSPWEFLASSTEVCVFFCQVGQSYCQPRVNFILMSQTGAPCHSDSINSNHKYPRGQPAVTSLKGNHVFLFIIGPRLEGLSSPCVVVWIFFWSTFPRKCSSSKERHESCVVISVLTSSLL